ncbi:PREDICTED: ATP-binding cassette sub-family A member 13 [Elephantulus edwardii]|uniref:ATP-binding cassette sub-family A member 13 n=1 Tax=Elephantulus edwardii TaxID=28737 RepID=UPI0003F05D14|nr:PREDICTED: ATP-binding cassette sub-family A member 13 [Elephantulus edwardii]
MRLSGHQFQVLLWKNWLCRLRHPVLSLAEFLWPCILFMILIVLRFQEPPRHRDTCFLQARDLPNQGIFPFVQSLLCNTGSQCRNVSYDQPPEHHFRTKTCLCWLGSYYTLKKKEKEWVVIHVRSQREWEINVKDIHARMLREGMLNALKISLKRS